MNSDSSSYATAVYDPEVTQENIDKASKLAEVEAAREKAKPVAEFIKPRKVNSSIFIQKVGKGKGTTRPVVKVESMEVETTPEIKPTSIATDQSGLYGPTKSIKTQQGPYSPTNKKKLSVDKPVDESADQEVKIVDAEGAKRQAPDRTTAMIKRAR